MFRFLSLAFTAVLSLGSSTYAVTAIFYPDDGVFGYTGGELFAQGFPGDFPL